MLKAALPWKAAHANARRKRDRAEGDRDLELANAREHLLGALGPARQRVLPTEPAQLGLDGRAYEPPEEPQSERPTACTDPPPVPRGALALRFGEAAQRELAFYRDSRSPAPRPTFGASANGGKFPMRAGEPLGHNTSNLAAPPKPHPMRRRMFRIREALRGGSGLPLCLHADETGKVSAYPNRVDRCGRVRIGGDVSVHVRTDDDGSQRATLRGLVRCGSVWACACCGLQIRTARGNFVGELLTRHRAAGGGHLLLTLTIRHGAGDDPERVIRGVQRAVSRLRARRGWLRAMARLGAIGDCKALEMTHGPNGWHPHAHAIVFTAWDVPPAVRIEVEDSLAHEWRQAVISEMEMKHAPDIAHGVDVRYKAAGDVASYITKLGLEIVDPGSKTARKQNRTPLDIAEAASRGESGALRLWQSYVRATHGLKFLTWSGRGRTWQDVRARYGMREQDDQTIVDGEDLGAVEVARVGAAEWDAGLREHALAIVELVESGGAPALHRALDRARLDAALRALRSRSQAAA